MTTVLQIFLIVIMRYIKVSIVHYSMAQNNSAEFPLLVVQNILIERVFVYMAKYMKCLIFFAKTKTKIKKLQKATVT